MADAAAFFAKKKKKKKAFKFNANHIDATTVTRAVHVDAPALSTDNDPVVTTDLPKAAEVVVAETNDSNEQWDEEKLASKTARKAAVANASAAELLDMKALDLKGSEQDDIAEKLRIEETKAQLAAAKEGMEREAQKLKEERENKNQGQGGGGGGATGNKPRFGAAAAGLAANGGKWVPRHMRMEGGTMPRGMGMGGMNQKLDTQDEQLFPDLAAADAMLQQKKEKPAYAVPKKTPVGGGATWGNKPKPKKAAAPKPEPAKEDVPQPAQEQPVATEEAKPEPAPAATAAAPVTKAPIKPKKKKKKKDLSTFKAAN
eukprot:CAMPEP_0113616210 /NCGR_PEP_ID=MMETSP0017_2-20120614/8119_1 /TAXON_ID=2856 /ORGANISM="Cylindrotheca closterium" /LENGTH=314 /DNA_ID=CAMNT_0000525511 /DNA_START=19 /DNA_END=963 /DNA_ORIENTATION=+ /assembly_acc=CAM_ASM_000147